MNKVFLVCNIRHTFHTFLSNNSIKFEQGLNGKLLVVLTVSKRKKKREKGHGNCKR